MNRFNVFKLIVISLSLAFTGCASKVNDEIPPIHQMTVFFSWPDNYGICFDPNNPEIVVSDIPAGTIYFNVNAIDTLNNYDHGGGKVMNDGTGGIAYGSVPNSKGPCPRQSPHLYGIYEFQVSAYNANDEMIGVGKYSRRFPEET